MMNKKSCISLLGHVDAGKTTLSESLLHKSGVIKNLGRVDNKNAFLDNNVMERERGITIYSKEARFYINDSLIQIIDTPGHVDFGAETERTLNVLDAAILLVSATDKVQSHTRTLWKLLRMHKIPTFIFVNKMDLASEGKADILKSVALDLKAHLVDFSDEEAPSFAEEVSSSSEKLIEKYLEGENPTEEEIREEIQENRLFPVVFGSALKEEGIERLLQVIGDYAPSYRGIEENSFYVYKVSRDVKKTRLSHIKCMGGSLSVKEFLGDTKVNELRIYNGESYENVQRVESGDVFVIPSFAETYPGKMFGKELFMHRTTLEPVISYSVFYPREIDTTKMLSALNELMEEEPGLQVIYDEDVREIKVCLMGEVQSQILIRRVKDNYGIDITLGQGKINYKETITDIVEGVGHFEPLRHYAEVHLRIEPLARGEGLVFDSEVSTDDLALNWQRLVLTHLKEKVHKGVLTGSPLTDVKITLVAGKAHLKHTEGGDFRQATYRAVRQGLMQAESVLLEPVYDFTLTVPSDMVGRAMTDMERLHAVCELSENNENTAVINGRGPVYTLNTYARDVYAYTRGLGAISLAPAGFEPCHNAEEIIESRAYEPTADLKNTPDSVFCMHGAGTPVSWDEVFSYMHLPFAVYENEPVDEEPVNVGKRNFTEQDMFVSVEEVDAIIDKTFYSNRKKVQVSSKGISASLKNRHREGGTAKEETVFTEYKGTKAKEKCMLIDGYNVVHAWPELSSLAEADLNAAAMKLMDIVSDYAGMSGMTTLLVFDAYKLKGHKTEENDYFNIKVVYTKTAQTADQYIERYAHENAKKYDITVVTSDGVEQVIIRGQGCTLVSSRDFEAMYENYRKGLLDSGVIS